MAKSKLTTSIVICALNEGKNLNSLLSTLIKQNQTNFKLKSITVISDGSTDNTVSETRKIHNKAMVLKGFRNTMGKAYRLSQEFKLQKSDLVVQIDADVKIYDTNFLDLLLQPLIHNKKVGMTGANAQPLPGKTFVEKAVNISVVPYVRMRQVCPSLSIGPVLAFRTELARKIKFPKEILGEDVYAYLFCLSNNYFYRYVSSALVFYRSPNNLLEHIRQSIRFIQAPHNVAGYFSHRLVEREDRIPKLLYLHELLKVFSKHPILGSYIFLVNKFCELLVRLSLVPRKKWTIAMSTK